MDNFHQVGDVEKMTRKFNFATAANLLVNVDKADFSSYKD